MRVWLQNKKKLISIDTQDEAKEKYEKVRVKKEEEAKKDTKEEDSKEEEKISTSKEDNKQPEQVVDQSVFDDLKMDIEKEHAKIVLNSILEKTRFLLKFSVPRVWSQDDRNGEYLMLDPESGENEMSMDFNESSLGSKLKSIQRIQSSKGSVRTYEDINSKEIFNSSGGSILAFLQCNISLEEVQKGVEERYINALNRYCGFRIMNKIMSLELEQDTLINTVNWFCSSLRNNKNKLAHYTNGLIGMGDYLRKNCCFEFYKIISLIIKKMRSTKDKNILAFYLSCLQWKIGANDHELLSRSGFFEVLVEGNHLDKKNNPIIYGWDSIQFGYDPNENPKFSDFFYQTMKYFIVSSFGRLVADNKEHLSLSGSQSKEVGQNTLLKAFSTINSQAVEILLYDLMKIIFNKVNIFMQEYESFEPGEYMIYSNFRDNSEYKNNLNTNIGFFEKEEQKEEQINENEDKFYEKLISQKIKKELSKDGSVSKYFESALMMLRLFEYILSVSMKMKEVQEFVLKTINPEFILNIIKIILMGHIRYSFIGVKLIEKMVKLGIKDSDLSGALNLISSSQYMKEFLTSCKKIHSEKSSFFSLILCKIAEIHKYKWVLSDHCHSQEFSLAKQLVFLAQKMIVSEHEPLWREEYERFIKDLTTNEDDYKIQEFETILALIGGQTVSCDFGSTGTLSGNEITVLGYSKDYSKNQLSPTKWNLKYGWNDKSQIPI